MAVSKDIPSSPVPSLFYQVLCLKVFTAHDIGFIAFANLDEFITG
jgi:hypothetical protein